MTDDDLRHWITEGANSGANRAADRMCKVQSAAWEGLMRAIDKGEDQLTNVELARAISSAVIEVLTDRGMSEEKILSVFREFCQQSFD